MSHNNYEAFAQTACFFQPKGDKLRKNQSIKPIDLANRQQLRKRSSARKFSLDQLLRSAESQRSLFAKDEVIGQYIAEKSLHLLNIPLDRHHGSIDALESQRQISQEHIVIKSYQQHRRTNSAHFSQVQLKVQTEMAQTKTTMLKNHSKTKTLNYPSNNGWQKQLKRPSTITEASDQINKNKLHYDVYSSTKIKALPKSNYKLFKHLPIELSEKDSLFIKKQTLAAKILKLPTLINDYEKKKDFRFKGKTFLQSKAQMNMVNKLFKN